MLCRRVDRECVWLMRFIEVYVYIIYKLSPSGFNASEYNVQVKWCMMMLLLLWTMLTLVFNLAQVIQFTFLGSKFDSVCTNIKKPLYQPSQLKQTTFSFAHFLATFSPNEQSRLFLFIVSVSHITALLCLLFEIIHHIYWCVFEKECKYFWTLWRGNQRTQSNNG